MSFHRVLQISDTHLLESSGAKFFRQDVDANLMSTLNAVNSSGPFHLVILTGDISQDGSAASYQRVSDMLDNLEFENLIAIPGNHDDPSILSEFLPITPCVLPPWIIIPLDSHWPHHVEGRLIEDELNRVQRVLDDIELSREIRFVSVAVHHPPHFNCAAPNCTLAEPEALLKLTRHDAVRLLISGHVHDDYTHQVGATLFSTCPSTCIGFDHNPAGHRTTTLPPGAIIYDLHDDGSVSRRAVYARKQSDPSGSSEVN